MYQQMPNRQHIIDNRDDKVSDYLAQSMAFADSLDVVSAYFTIYGYELLEDRLRAMNRVRFLYGDPASVEDVDPGDKEAKSFQISERGLEPKHSLNQKHLAQRCAEWICRDSVHIRSIKQSNFLHGKMYLTSEGKRTASGIVGSSNFTKSGLGGSDRPNLEINLATTQQETLDELQEWFDSLWNDRRQVEDAKQQVLDALNRIGSDYSPEAVYYKTLYELFRDELEARLEGDEAIDASGFLDSEIWNALYAFQKDGVRSVLAKLGAHNGCILADSVGLGKTYTALAVIKYFEQQPDSRVLVLCPKKLSANWQLYQVANNHSQNPFKTDRFGYTLLAHTDLSRDSGMSGSVNLSDLDWSDYRLVVIDESHNFRNSDGQRYQRLLNEVIKRGRHTKVLMLSATPVNTSLTDIRNQIYLMTEGRRDVFEKSLGVANIDALIKHAQEEFDKWERRQKNRAHRNKNALLENLGAGFLRLLDGVSIARSRRHVKQFYADEMQRVGEFPHREKPVNRYPVTDLRDELSYEDLSDDIGRFQLRQYRPSEYIKGANRSEQLPFDDISKKDIRQSREYYLVGMMRTNFLKRLESSAHSLTLTLERTIAKIDDILRKIDLYEQNGIDASLADDTHPEEDEEDEDMFIGKGESKHRLSELDLPRWRAHLLEDRQVLEGVLVRVKAVDHSRDGKLKRLRADITQRAASPTRNMDGMDNRKILVFTSFKDTAQYLYDNLREQASVLGMNIAMVSGDETRASAGRNEFNAILSNFAPAARGRADGGEDIDVLIATDCISEGQNLQDCDIALNYDIHWNPVRLIQRFGRIDRIGSRSKSVRMLNYWPTQDMDKYLNLQNRVYARMAIADMAASGDDDLLDDETMEREASQERRFRDAQTRRLMKEVVDMDDLTDAPVMSDFTLDYFLAQLLRYLERNKDALEAMPPGAYAVTDDPAENGVIFFLRQRNASDDSRQAVASPVHPYHFVYIRENGNIRYGCANARQALTAFEQTSAGKTEAITRLCDRFDRETNQGNDMSLYDKLVTDAIAHIRQAHTEAQNRGARMTRDFLFTKTSETPRDENDFELVTWLVIKSE